VLSAISRWPADGVLTGASSRKLSTAGSRIGNWRGGLSGRGLGRNHPPGRRVPSRLNYHHTERERRSPSERNGVFLHEAIDVRISRANIVVLFGVLEAVLFAQFATPAQDKVLDVVVVG